MSESTDEYFYRTIRSKCASENIENAVENYENLKTIIPSRTVTVTIPEGHYCKDCVFLSKESDISTSTYMCKNYDTFLNSTGQGSEKCTVCKKASFEA